MSKRYYALVVAVVVLICGLVTHAPTVLAESGIEYRLVKVLAKNENGARTEIRFDGQGRVQQPLELGFLEPGSGLIYNHQLGWFGHFVANPTYGWMDRTRVRTCWLVFERQGGEVELEDGSTLKLHARTRVLPSKGGTNVSLSAHVVIETIWEWRTEKDYVIDGWEYWGIRARGQEMVWDAEFGLEFRVFSGRLGRVTAPRQIALRLDPAFGSDSVTTLWLQELPTSLTIIP